MNTIKNILKFNEYNIKKLYKINEKLGIPPSVIEVSEKIYNNILKHLNKNKNKIIYNKEDNNTLQLFETSVELENVKINKVPIIIEVVFVDDKIFKELNIESDVELFNLKMKLKPKKHKNMIFYDRGETPVCEIILNFAVNKRNEKIKIEDIYQYLLNNKHHLGSFAHEIKHIYDHYSKQIYFINTFSEYNAFVNNNTGIKPLDEFLFSLYLTHNIENLVKPTEIGILIKKHNVTKKEFLNFLKDTNVYKNLIKAKNFSYEKLKKDLLKHVESIKENILDSGLYNEKDLNNLSDEDIVHLTLKTFHEFIINKKIENIFNSVPIEQMIIYLLTKNMKDMPPEIIKSLKKIKHTKNYENYYKSKEKTIKENAEKTLKKLYKLYDMCVDDDVNDNNIHTKINLKTIKNKMK